MTNYIVRHTTRYEYDLPVVHAHHMARLRPRQLSHQRVISSELVVKPGTSSLTEKVDYFGNIADALEVADWLRTATDPDVVVAAAPAIDEQVLALSGRTFVSGFPGWTYDLGVPDWSARATDAQTILQGGPEGLATARARGAELVVIGPIERGPAFGADEAWWAANAELVEQSGPILEQRDK